MDRRYCRCSALNTDYDKATRGQEFCSKLEGFICHIVLNGWEIGNGKTNSDKSRWNQATSLRLGDEGVNRSYVAGY